MERHSCGMELGNTVIQREGHIREAFKMGNSTVEASTCCQKVVFIEEHSAITNMKATVTIRMAKRSTKESFIMT